MPTVGTAARFLGTCATIRLNGLVVLVYRVMRIAEVLANVCGVAGAEHRAGPWGSLLSVQISYY